MQDALPAFVLNSETLPRKPMSDAPANPENSPTQREPQRPRLSDERLMLAFTQGSSEAFTELFHRYKQPLYGFFCRRVSDPVSAEELTQETFFALLRAAVRYEPRALFRTYLYAIGFKILRAQRRKAAFRAAFLGHPNSASDPSKHDATECGLWVRRAIAKLEPVDRETVMLRDCEQLISADRAQSVSAHIRECTECHDMVASLSKTSRSLTAWTVPTSQPHVGDDVTTASTKTLASLSAAGFGTLPPRGWSWQRWALTLTAAGCAFLLLLWIPTPN